VLSEGVRGFGLANFLIGKTEGQFPSASLQPTLEAWVRLLEAGVVSQQEGEYRLALPAN